MNGLSLNNRLIVEPYQSDRQLKATSGTGFAMIAQKVSLKGLRVLMDAHIKDLGNYSRHTTVDGISDGITAPKIIGKGCIAYIREELLYTQEWAKKTYECEGIEGKFMIVDIQNVEFIDYKA